MCMKVSPAIVTPKGGGVAVQFTKKMPVSAYPYAGGLKRELYVSAVGVGT